MKKVKIGFSGKTIPQQIQRARDITGKMTGNPGFVTPNPTIPDVILLTDKLEGAYIDALNGGKDKKAKMRIEQKALLSGIATLAAYVQTTSGGDETLILRAGFEVRKQPEPVSIPAAPQDVKVLPAVKEGELEIVWTPVKTAKSYVVEYVKDPLTEAGFIPVDIITKASVVIKDLEAGEKYWFRVLAVNTKGKSAWSEPCSGRVWQF